MKPIDFLGRDIKTGDLVVYPVRRGSSMWLKRVMVTGIETRGQGFTLIGYDPVATAQRRIHVCNLSNTIVVENSHG